jgi:hypothetical protein
MAKEIKIVIGRGGRTKILAPGVKGSGTAKFTEDLAKDLGKTEERHKGVQHEKTPKVQNQQEQGN